MEIEMKKYPWVVVTPVETPKPTEIDIEEYGHFYRVPLLSLGIAVWGFVNEAGATKFITIASYQSEPFYVT